MGKKRNKGFSLVELIIVIAIMAILIGVLAPQYIKYVEKSRVSHDEDTALALLETAHTMMSDEEMFEKLNNNDRITFGAGGISGSTTDINSALQEYFGDNYEQNFPKSKVHKNQTYSIVFSASYGAFTLLDGWG